MFRRTLQKLLLHDIIASLHYDERFILDKIDRRNSCSVNGYGSTPLHYACISQRKEVIKKLVDLNVNINACDNSGRTPLMIACRNCDIEIVDILLKNGANVSLEDKYGNTAIMIACHRQLENKEQFFENEQIVEKLIENGAMIRDDLLE